ncbi:expressed protein [Phakopsora pachyrhizi]|uniref:Expressed protein n=1 Tax=Phakopsora pachyrhizi TaxID=170000 RepID=A0AAV0BPF6_PHAPC|nr:expressed protein [Phakopsora pachyrhizi]
MVNNRSTNQNRNHRQQPTEQLNSENHQNSNSNSNSLVRRQPVQKSLSSTLIQALYLKPTSITQRDSSNHNQTNKHHHYSPLRLICLLISPFNRIGLGYRASSIILILITFGIIDLLKNPQNSSIDPDCGPNRAGLIKTRSQLIRLRDRMRDEPFEILRGLEALPDFETELSQQSFDLAGRWLRSINGSQSISQRSNQLTATTTLTSQPDVTAVILNWNRPESVIVIVGHLCRYEFVESVIVWNNNPTRPLTGDDFRSTQCPNRKIRIYNSPTNQYFFARYLACLQSSTRFCFFQDDDCIVRSIRTMYYQFKSLQPDQALVVVQSDPTYSVMYNWEWCFKNQLENLNTCFAWLGHGSFVSKSAVSEFVNWIGDQSLSSDLIALSDNFFTTSLNREPSVIVQKEIVALSLNPNDGFSDGRLGLERNRIYIQKGVERLANQLSQGTQLRLGNTRPKKEALVEIKANEKFDRYFLLTNIESFDKENRPTFKKFDDDYGLNDWEDRLGNIGMKLGRLSNYKKSKRREDESNGWKGGREEWLRLEDEAVRFGQFAAMDGNNDTFWKPNSCESKPTSLSQSQPQKCSVSLLTPGVRLTFYIFFKKMYRY